MAENNLSCIGNFYAKRSVFITGGTGFIGKVLIEKLLRSCHEIQNIFVLLRPKKGQEPTLRLEEFLQEKVFERVKNEIPGSLSKVVAISGDLALPELGINPSDQLSLIENVSVVFHAAATVRFDSNLKESVNLNVLGTRRLITLSRKMEHLKAFIHVSTAFCNCEKEVLDEVVYQTPISPQKLIEMLEWMDSDLVDNLTPHLIDKKPNTYTYTKALAETLIVNEHGNLPVAIVRPSIVTAAWEEPYPGWIDNINGITGLLLTAGKGILRTFYNHPTNIANIIPVDTVVNLLISVGWYTASQRLDSILVYNYSVNKTNNKLTWNDIQDLTVPLLWKNPYEKTYFCPSAIYTNSRLWNKFSILLYHYLPAYFIDFSSALIGRKTKFVSMYNKLHQTLRQLDFFGIYELTVISNNALELYKNLTIQDKTEFNFDIRTLQWSTYMENYLLGIREFVMKEDPSTIPTARKNLKRKYLFIKTAQVCLISLFLFNFLPKKVTISVLIQLPWKIIEYFLNHYTFLLKKNV